MKYIRETLIIYLTFTGLIVVLLWAFGDAPTNPRDPYVPFYCFVFEDDSVYTEVEIDAIKQKMQEGLGYSRLHCEDL